MNVYFEFILRKCFVNNFKRRSIIKVPSFNWFVNGNYGPAVSDLLGVPIKQKMVECYPETVLTSLLVFKNFCHKDTKAQRNTKPW